MRFESFFRIFFTAWIIAVLFVCQCEAYGRTPEDNYPQVIEPSLIHQLAIETVDANFATAGDDRRHTVDIAYIPRNIRAPLGELSYSASIPNGLRFWGSTAVYIDINVDGVLFRRVKCQFKIHIFEKIAVAARVINPGSPITDSDFRFEEREIGSQEKKYLTESDEITGKILSRPIAMGAPIYRSFLRRPVIMKAGSSITLIAKSGGVEVRMEGTALEPGRVDDVIRVKNSESKKIRRARVIDESTVEIL